MKEIERREIPPALDSRIREFEQQGFSLLVIHEHEEKYKNGRQYAAALENQDGVALIVACRLKTGGGQCVAYSSKDGWQGLASRLESTLHLWQHAEKMKSRQTGQTSDGGGRYTKGRIY